MNLSNQLDDIFHIYTRYCEITMEVYCLANESNEATLARDALSRLLELVEYKRMSILEEVSVLMSRLTLMADCHEFPRFYNFVFFICRQNGQKSIRQSWLGNQYCLEDSDYSISGAASLRYFYSNNQRHNISEDTWMQVLPFSRCVHENLEGYDPKGAWPVLIDEFVEHMYRMNGSDGNNSLSGKCCDPEPQLIYEPLPGLKVFPGAKRKMDEDSRGQEFDAMDAYMISKRRLIDSANKLVNGGEYQQIVPTYNYMEHVKHNNPFGCSKSPCAVKGCLSKGFAEHI